MLTIPCAEHDRLREAAEELADIEAYDRAMEANGQSIPSKFVTRMINGESPLRVFRDLRGMTQSALAERSGVNRVQIAQIEAGTRTGSVETLRKLAAILDVTIDDLV